MAIDDGVLEFCVNLKQESLGILKNIKLCSNKKFDYFWKNIVELIHLILFMNGKI